MIHLEIQLFLIRLYLAKSFDNCKICAYLAFAGFFLTIIVFYMLQHGNLLKYFDLIKQNIVKAVVHNVVTKRF